ncbi:MAG TPA: hypothetical protein VLF94_03675 [Chlamydiales bacterium]|nr:hypothetical protein [Chlamydiales bacterium]
MRFLGLMFICCLASMGFAQEAEPTETPEVTAVDEGGDAADVAGDVGSLRNEHKGCPCGGGKPKI